MQSFPASHHSSASSLFCKAHMCPCWVEPNDSVDSISASFYGYKVFRGFRLQENSVTLPEEFMVNFFTCF
jgi:hypothetical protein